MPEKRESNSQIKTHPDELHQFVKVYES